MGHMSALAFFASVAVLFLLLRHWWGKRMEAVECARREQQLWEQTDCEGRTSLERMMEQLPEVFDETGE